MNTPFTYLEPKETIYEYSGEFQQYCAWCGNPIKEDDPVIIIPYYLGELKDNDDIFTEIYHKGSCYEEAELDTPVIYEQVGLKCLRCNDEIYSNSGHDFVSCSCGARFIDGGFNYIRTGGLPYIPTESISRTINRARLKHYYYEEIGGRKEVWTHEQCMKWNKEHWDEVGEAVTNRLAWWETARNLPDHPYGEGEIDV